MAVRKINLSLPDSRKDVALRNDPTRVDPRKLKLGKQVARHRAMAQRDPGEDIRFPWSHTIHAE